MITEYVRYGTLQSQIVRVKCDNTGSIEKRFLLCIGDKNREHLADIANPAMVESATNPTALFALPTAGVHTARENGTAIPIKSPCKYFAGFFIADSARIAIFSATVLRGKNRSKSCFIPKYLPKKFPNPRVKFAPMPLNSRNPPLFSAISTSKVVFQKLFPRVRAARISQKNSRRCPCAGRGLRADNPEIPGPSAALPRARSVMGAIVKFRARRGARFARCAPSACPLSPAPCRGSPCPGLFLPDTPAFRRI